MTLFQAFLTAIYGLTVIAVCLFELRVTFVSAVRFFDKHSVWWEKIIYVAIAILAFTVGIWELDHDFWHDQMFVWIHSL